MCVRLLLLWALVGIGALSSTEQASEPLGAGLRGAGGREHACSFMKGGLWTTKCMLRKHSCGGVCMLV
eukprot:7635281-Alexandrium_andersonii.AAC.1